MNKLKKIRTDKGISPSFVAKKLGISYRHFYRIETGQGFLTKERAILLSKLYGVSVECIEKAFEGE